MFDSSPQMKGAILTTLILLLAFASGSGAAEYDLNPHVRGSWPNLEQGDNQVPYAAIAQPYALVLNQNNLNVLDLSSAAQPTLLSSLAMPQTAIRLAVSGAIAGVTLGEGGVAFVDFSDPRAPRIRSQMRLSGNVFAITMSGTRAYVSGQDTGLHVIDFSDPDQPSSLGRAATARIGAHTALYGNYAYVSAYQDGLQIFDISDPASMRLVGTFTAFTGLVREAAIRETTLFAATDGGFMALDLSVPARPAVMADDRQLASNFTIIGDTAYVAGDGMRLIDISNPASPQIRLNTALLNGKVIGKTDSIVYILNGQFQIAEFQANPQRMTRFPALGNTVAVTVARRHAFLPGGAEGLRIADVFNTADARVVAQQPEPADALDIQGSLAAAVGASGFRLIDISRPGEPATLGSIAGAPMIDVAIHGSHAFAIAAGANGNSFAAIDCSDRSNPEVKASPPARDATALTIANGHAFVAEHGLRIFDLSDPDNPRQTALLQSLSYVAAQDVAVRGHAAFLVTYAGFWVFNVSDPSAPRVLGRWENIPLVPFSRICLSGHYAYLADRAGGLHVFDIRNPARPERVGGNVQVNASGLYASGDTLYIAERANGLTILDLFRPDAKSIRLTALSPDEPGVARLRATGPPGAAAQIERLEDGVWKPWKPLATEHSPMDFIDPDGSAAVQLYRIVAPAAE